MSLRIFNSVVGSGFGGGVENISMPSEFIHGLSPFKIIYKNGAAQITNKSINDLRNTSVAIIKYVDGISGVDTNNGDTTESAYKTLSKALSVSCDRIILITPGNYTTLSNSTFTANKEIISPNGNSVIGRGLLGSARTWVNDGGGMYHTISFSLLVPVCSDISVKDDNNVPSKLEVKTSSVDVAANVNSYWKDAANSILYVHTIDGRQPDANIFIVTDHFNVNAPATPFKVHLEGITLLKGLKITNSTVNKTTLTLDNSILCHDYNSADLLTISGNVEAWIKNTIVAGSNTDNINYKESGIYSPSIVEENIISYDAGIGNNTSINNASTGHGPCSILRINGDYSKSEGPCVHDVNASLSFNINCYAH